MQPGAPAADPPSARTESTLLFQKISASFQVLSKYKEPAPGSAQSPFGGPAFERRKPTHYSDSEDSDDEEEDEEYGFDEQAYYQYMCVEISANGVRSRVLTAPRSSQVLQDVRTVPRRSLGRSVRPRRWIFRWIELPRYAMPAPFPVLQLSKVASAGYNPYAHFPPRRLHGTGNRG